MINQGVVQETLAELNSAGGVLPPLHNLPHWSRVNNFDKARYPKPFLKDRLQPLPNPSDMESPPGVGPQEGAEKTEEEGQVDSMAWGMNPSQRVVHLERSIHFLQQQHHEILSNLHEEIDSLKRENKELHFRIVMIQKKPDSAGSLKNSRRGSQVHQVKDLSRHQVAVPPSIHKETPVHSAQNSQASDEKIEELKIIFLEEEIKDLRKALREERNQNHHLQQLLEKYTAEKGAQSHPRPLDQKPHSAHVAPSQPLVPLDQQPHSTQTAPHPPASVSDDGSVSDRLPYNATLNPLRVHLPRQPSRPPTIKESEVIIKHLQRTNDNQAHELSQLKSDLRDVLYSHKWTPDAFLLAKAYVAEDDARELAEQNRLPKIALKQSTRKLPDIAYIQKDALSLPAMKHTMGNKAIERRKRAQILQKSRLSNKEVAN